MSFSIIANNVEDIYVFYISTSLTGTVGYLSNVFIARADTGERISKITQEFYNSETLQYLVNITIPKNVTLVLNVYADTVDIQQNETLAFKITKINAQGVTSAESFLWTTGLLGNTLIGQ
jgi:hypothetical protein